MNEQFEKWLEEETMGTATKAEKELAERAWNAALESQWQPIETIPHDLFVDVWVSAKNIPDYGRRMTDVCRTDKHSSAWVNIEKCYLTDDLRPTRWMLPPKAPE